jgi:2-iminobutanoate/2-iminopropanoate deaminase
MRTAITVPGAPIPAGPYSHAVRVGDLVFVSGQVPRAADGSYAPADVGTETRRTLENLQTIASAAGAELAGAVKITAYLADGSYFDEFNRAYAEFFPADPPARTTVVAGLRQVKVELDAVLYIGP